MVLLMVVFFTGVAMTARGLPKAEDVLIGALAALLTAINSRNRDRASKPE
jgi:hypothetical protein